MCARVRACMHARTIASVAIRDCARRTHDPPRRVLIDTRCVHVCVRVCVCVRARARGTDNGWQTPRYRSALTLQAGRNESATRFVNFLLVWLVSQIFLIYLPDVSFMRVISDNRRTWRAHGDATPESNFF